MNTFTGQAGKAQDIWSYGHRNILGIAFDAKGQLWDLEHGPAGGDELNLVRKGANYGWPMLEIEKWDTPQPMRGAQGLWNWPDAEKFAEDL